MIAVITLLWRDAGASLHSLPSSASKWYGEHSASFLRAPHVALIIKVATMTHFWFGIAKLEVDQSHLQLSLSL